MRECHRIVGPSITTHGPSIHSSGLVMLGKVDCLSCGSGVMIEKKHAHCFYRAKKKGRMHP